MEYLLLALTKFIDNMITTAKNITLYQNKYLISAILTTISQFLFFFVVSSVVTDGNILSMIIVSISAGLGSYIASYINQKFIIKDKMFLNVITCSNITEMEMLASFLYQRHIKCILYEAYTRYGKKTYAIQAFAKTKEESAIIDGYIHENNINCLREIVE